MLGALALPDDGVERAQQGAGADRAGQGGVPVEVRRALPPLDAHREQLAVVDQLVDRDLRGLGARTALDLQPVVVGQAAHRGHAVAGRGPADQLLGRGRLVERGRGQHGGGQHPLGHVVDRLELGVAPGDRQVAGEVEPVERLARLRPVPAPVDLAPRAAVVEVARRRGAARPGPGRAPARPSRGWPASRCSIAGCRGRSPSGGASPARGRPA